MVHLILESDRPWLDREPTLTYQSYLKMARSEYEFLRGTSTLFISDLQQPGAWPTDFGTPDSNRVATVGDSHPENFGAYRAADGTFVIDINDFDGADFGPYHFDLRRLAFSWVVAARAILSSSPLSAASSSAPSQSLERLWPFAKAAVDGYLSQITSTTPTLSPLAPLGNDLSSYGPILSQLVADARKKGDKQKQLTDFTKRLATHRVFHKGVLRLPKEDGIPVRELRSLSTAEKWMVREIVDQWPATILNPASRPELRYTIVDAGRRVGAGVGSFPVLRYYVLLAGPRSAQDPSDYIILDLKESSAPPTYLNQIRFPLHSTYSNAERTVWFQRQMQSKPDTDPLLGYANLESGTSFRIQSRWSYQRGIDLKDLIQLFASSRITETDLTQLATITGSLLAAAHARAMTANNRLGAEVILEAIHGAPDAFAQETLSFVQSYLPTFLLDFQSFRRLIKNSPPFLSN